MPGVPRLRPRQVDGDHAGSDSGGVLQAASGYASRGAVALEKTVVLQATCTSPCTHAHPIFGRKGDNLSLTAPVTFQEAALGAEIEVPTLGGPSVKLRLSPGTPNGRALRVRGKGVLIARRHQGRPTGHRRGAGARGTQRTGARGAELLRRGGRPP